MNQNTIVRICEIYLQGFKNTEEGIVILPSATKGDFFSTRADILGIYGQNGSGKTAIIEAMDYIQQLLMGGSVSAEFANYISKAANTCKIRVKFAIATEKGRSLLTYSVEFKRVSESDHMISRETLGMKKENELGFDTHTVLIDCNTEAENQIFLPVYRCKALIKEDEKNLVNLEVAKAMSRKMKTSFIFGDEGRKIFMQDTNATKDYAHYLRSLRNYAQIGLFVLTGKSTGAIGMHFLLPVSFRMDVEKGIAKGELPIRLNGPSVLSQQGFDILSTLLENMNQIVCTFIPGLSVEIHDLGTELSERGEKSHRFELLSVRGGKRIPLRYESEGIIKLLSILNVLMSVYNDPSACLFMDELDSGIFEYLLGELLSVFEKGAKGQFIFTSHNLRALEMLDKKSILFSTANPKNRYIRFQNLKNNHNLRNTYLRSILLGGQKEKIYEETDSVEIGRAFRRVGRMIQDGKSSG